MIRISAFDARGGITENQRSSSRRIRLLLYYEGDKRESILGQSPKVAQVRVEELVVSRIVRKLDTTGLSPSRTILIPACRVSDNERSEVNGRFV